MTKRKEAIPKYSRNPSSNGGGAILDSSYNIVSIDVVVDNWIACESWSIVRVSTNCVAESMERVCDVESFCKYPKEDTKSTEDTKG